MTGEEGSGGGAARPTRPAAPPADPVLELPPRYERAELVGQGGQGLVYRVHDRELERDVALKTIPAERLSQEQRSFFVREARAAAGIEHPGVVPIHDVGELPDGRPYYTMRLLAGRTFGEVLEDEGWSLLRLCQALQQVCRALQAAHERGIVHRDVKPPNVLLGDLDEVLVVDFGLAKSSSGAPASTTTGVVKGTLAYMAPEQARGERATPASDLYAVGVMLYEILCGRLPFEAPTGGELIAAILRDEPAPPERWAEDRSLPQELTALAMRLLEKDPARRPPSARAVADELQAFLEGLRDRERRGAAADELVVRAVSALAVHQQAEAESEGLRGEIARLEEEHPAWQPVERKLPLIDARSMLEELERSSWTAFLDAVNRYTDALVHVPEHEAARAALAELFWERFREAEERGAEALAETCRRLVERWHDGRYARELEGHGSLELEIEPTPSRVELRPLVEKNLVLVEGQARELPAASVRVDDLAMGSWLLTVEAEGRAATRYPLRIDRCAQWKGRLRLPPAEAVPEGFVFVPGGPARLGGDRRANQAWPARTVEVEDFAISVHPVTFAEWCEFLADLKVGEEEDLVPAAQPVGSLCRRDESGEWQPLAGLEDGEEFLERFGREARPRVPVIGISRPWIERYLAWRSERDARGYRLPTAQEWEKAARGADGRHYPWGERFDAALCHLRESTAGQPYVGPIGAAAGDVSVFGVRDLAGGVQEWTGSWFDESRGLVEVRGGSWAQGAGTARAAWRGACPVETRSLQLGFRLVVDV